MRLLPAKFRNTHRRSRNVLLMHCHSLFSGTPHQSDTARRHHLFNTASDNEKSRRHYGRRSDRCGVHDVRRALRVALTPLRPPQRQRARGAKANGAAATTEERRRHHKKETGERHCRRHCEESSKEERIVTPRDSRVEHIRVIGLIFYACINAFIFAYEITPLEHSSFTPHFRCRGPTTQITHQQRNCDGNQPQ